jgi:apolipoprotein D and lipocalin family protein
MDRNVVRLLAPLLAVFGLTGCQSTAHPPLPLAAHVDMDRMYGGWHIVATIPNGFEKGMVEPYDVYSKRPDGDIREDFYMRKGGFAAPKKHFVVHDWVKPGTHNAHWRVQVLWPVNLPFLVLYVDPDYRYVLYGEEGRDLGWIYARSLEVPQADYRALLARFQAVGYDPSKFRKFVQKPEDIGQPGFWSDGVKAPVKISTP